MAPGHASAVPAPARALSRRDALGRGLAFGVLAVFGAGACANRKARAGCADTTGLSPEDVRVRVAIGYEDVSPQPERRCSRCLQFTAAAPNACAACKIVRGPISPSGTCKVFVAIPA